METSIAARRGVEGFTWEDLGLNAPEDSSLYHVTEAEMIAFAGRYDPLPIHIDPAAAAASQFGALTASGVHMLAIRMRLVHDFAYGGGVIAGIGLDEVRFLAPLRAGQNCQVRMEVLEKRPSGKRTDRGVAVIAQTLLADGTPVLSLKDIVLMRRRV